MRIKKKFAIADSSSKGSGFYLLWQILNGEEARWHRDTVQFLNIVAKEYQQ